jgi:hypothetical protein
MESAILTAVIFLVFLALGVLVVVAVQSYIRKARLREQQQETQFYTGLATTLGTIYSPIGVVPDPLPFIFGRLPHINNELSGSYNNIPFRMDDYSWYALSSPHSGFGRYHYLLAEVTLPVTLPAIFCRPAYYTVYVPIDEWKKKGSQTASISKDFDSRFTVYIPEGQEGTGAIFTPEVLTELMSGSNDFGFCTIGTHLYIFRKVDNPQDRDKILMLYALMKRFCDLLATPEARP